MRVYFNVKGKEENPYLEKFIRHYVKYKRINLKNITIEAIEESNKSSPDYYIKELNLLVEVKRVVNREETEESAKYNQFTLKLKKILEQRVIGQYMISIPFFYSTSKGKQISKIADEIDKAIKNNLNECSVEQLGKVKINTISKKGAGVCFSTHSQPTFRNPPQEVHKNIENSLKKANKQLASHKFRKKKCQKILLFVNHYRLFDHKWQFIEALTYSYKKLLTYPNINFIWILKGEKTDPELIYSRDFLLAFNKKTMRRNPLSVELFQKWYYPLFKQKEDATHAKLYAAFKNIIGNSYPHQVFKDTEARELMIDLGDFLREKEKFHEIIWFIEKFIKDPDPPIPGSREFTRKDLHNVIISGNEDDNVTTVLGRLVWVIQALCVKKKYIKYGLKYTSTLARHKNLHVVCQTLIPLIEIARRRIWLSGYPHKTIGEFKKFDKVVFTLLKLIEENPNYKAFYNNLCFIFQNYQELGTKEANKVLKTLGNDAESAYLYIYYALFRKRHFKKYKIKFNHKIFEKKLFELITTNLDANEKLSEKILWSFWKGIREDSSLFNTFKPYIELYIKKENLRNRNSGVLLFIVEDNINKHVDICIAWFLKILDCLENIAEPEKYIYFNTSKVMDEIAKFAPKKYSNICLKIFNLWEKGILMTDLDKTLLSYKYINDDNVRESSASKSKEIYKNIKKLAPNYPALNFE